MYSTYYSIKSNVKKANIPVKQLVKQLKELHKQLQQIDPTIIIYEYNNNIPNEAITTPNNMPNDISILKKFFNNISIKPNGGHTWFQVWLGHDDPVSNILANMKYWSSQQDSYIYQKRLQEKYTTKDYWLMWSTERMDSNILHQEVSHQLSKFTTHNLKFSFNFGQIRKDPRFITKESYKKQYNRAMIIEAQREQKEEIYQALAKIFSTSNNIKILGTSMRMVPMLSSDLPSHTKMKISHLIAKQEQFLSVLRIKPCAYLQEIDYYNTTLKTSLREIIMNLQTLHTSDKGGNPIQVFINVDYSEWHNSYVLTFPSHLEKEADDYISQLPAFLHYIYGDEVLFMLNPEGQMKALQSTWDPETLCATSNLDLELDAITTESSNITWLSEPKTNIQVEIPNIDLQNKIFEKASDADSVSTFQINHKDSHHSSIISPTPNKNIKASHQQTREFVDSHDENKTSKDAESSLEDPL